jgi:hypothetical protein
MTYRIRDFMKVTYDYLQFGLQITGIYFIWIIIYFIASHLHVYYCVPATIYGFIMSPFMITSQHCQALRWIIYHGGNNIVTMWIIFATWIMQYLRPMTL